MQTLTRLSQSRRRPLYVTRRIPLYHPDFPFILMWSQKAGCTTVVNWFFDQVGLLEEALEYRPWVHLYEVEVYKRRPDYVRETMEAMGSGRYRVVKVVRHPFRRAASGFLVLGDGPSARAGHWAAGYWKQAAEWLAARGLDASDGLSFSQHLEHLAERERTLGRFDAVNLHVAQQHVPGEDEVVQEYVPIERFADWASEQSAARGLKESDFAALGSSGHHHGADEERTARLGDRPEEYRLRRAEFADHRFPDAQVLVNERSMPRLRVSYGRDVAAYGPLYGIAPAA